MQLDYRGARCNEGRGAIPAVHAGENHTIQIALVGCGGRGTGAAANALATKSGPIKLVAMADVFEHRLKSSYETLTSIGGDAGNGSPDRAVAGYDPAQVDVPPDRRFLGFDAYKKAMDCLGPGDVVLLTTPARSGGSISATPSIRASTSSWRSRRPSMDQARGRCWRWLNGLPRKT